MLSKTATDVRGRPAKPVPPLHPFGVCLAAPFTGAVAPLHPLGAELQADYREHLRSKYGGNHPITDAAQHAYNRYLASLSHCDCGQPLVHPVSLARGFCEQCRLAGPRMSATRGGEKREKRHDNQRRPQTFLPGR